MVSGSESPGQKENRSMELGKRYICEESGVEIVVTKGGPAVITCVNAETGEIFEFKRKD
ncbi:MAG: hypothetical protein IID61_05510 [SAR324 cluster bacterium]|nr:hypothetical protein [SAR324 cluster bacterium]